MGWTVLVPVKELALAKSRLRGALAAVPHEDLVLALVLDTLAAALACPAVAEVVVVTADEAVAAAARGLGAKVLGDAPRGLNPALAHAAAAVAGERGQRAAARRRGRVRQRRVQPARRVPEHLGAQAAGDRKSVV